MAPGSAGGAPLGSGTLGREALARRADVLAALVLLGSAGADDRRRRQPLGALVPDGRVERARGEAAALDVAQHALAGAGGGDRRLAAEPRERQRPLRVDLADARGNELHALGIRTEARGGCAGIDALDESDRVVQARLLDERALERGDGRVE